MPGERMKHLIAQSGFWFVQLLASDFVQRIGHALVSLNESGSQCDEINGHGNARDAITNKKQCAESLVHDFYFMAGRTKCRVAF